MVQEHERATHGWQVEWLTFSQMVLLAGGALKNALFLAENLKINKTRMRENLNRSNYLVMAEAVVGALSAEIPRTEAHAMVKDACAVAVSKDASLIEVVKKQYSAVAPNNKIDWQALAKPENYLGQAEHFIDRVIEQAKRPKGR